jgi:3-oxoacyl-[acyl-carrier-protein] synthase II
MLKYLPNMAASHISIALDARGPNNTICQGDVSGALAIIEGADLLRRDWADLAIVGGTSSRVSPVGMLYRGAAQLSSRSADPTRAVRPFAADRDGNVHSEGAGAIVLDTPRRPGFDTSRSLGRLVGWARGFGDYRRPDFSEAIVAVARQALANAMVTVDDLSHINATGTSTMTGDWHEAVAIQALSSRTPVIAPSANIGNPGPSGSVLEIIASLAALRHQQLPPTLTGDIAPEFQMDLVRELRERRQENFLKLAFADTGQIAALVFAC